MGVQARHGMSNLKLIDQAWRSYSEVVIPAHAGAVQRQEMRRAFYAGATTLLGSIMVVLDPGDEPTEADLQKMQGIHDELEQFTADLKRGKA